MFYVNKKFPILATLESISKNYLVFRYNNQVRNSYYSILDCIGNLRIRQTHDRGTFELCRNLETNNKHHQHEHIPRFCKQDIYKQGRCFATDTIISLSSSISS